MEGSYSKVWSAREEAPADEYKFFVDSLMGTIRWVPQYVATGPDFWHFAYRNEIASCEEAAYDSLPLKDAATLLFFTNRNDLVNFAQQVWYTVAFISQQFTNRMFIQRGWQVNLVAESITFKKKDEERIVIPKARLIAANLAYARELEQIV